jgi:hypothetical protein
MQIHHVGAARGLMQPIDILGNKKTNATALFERSQRPVRIVGPCASNAPPPNEATRPIPFACRELVHEGTELHRLRPFPAAVGVPIIRNTRIGTHTRAGEHKKSGVSLDEPSQSITFHPESIEHPAARDRR